MTLKIISSYGWSKVKEQLHLEIIALMTTLLEMYHKQSSDWETFLDENEQAMKIAIMGRRLGAKYNNLYSNSR